MGLIKVMPFVAGAAKSGVSIGQGETRGRQFYRIGLTGPAQDDLFGRRLDPARDAISLTLTNDPKYLHLLGIKLVGADDPAGLPISGAPHGSIGVKVAAWRPGSGDKRPPASMVIVNRQVAGGGISVKLPEWARPAPDLTASSIKG